MKFAFLVLAAALSCANGQEVDRWVRLGEAKGAVAYVDAKTLGEVSGPYRKVWIRYDYSKAQKDVGETFLSEKQLHLVNCAEKRSAVKARYMYEGAQGQGKMLRHAEREDHHLRFTSAVPQSALEDLVEIACKP